jgi:hypothetical protein
MRIERATFADLPGAYRTCLLTGHARRDTTARYRDPDLLDHVYVGPYIVRGAGTQLVAVDEAGAEGYLVSADDTLSFECGRRRTGGHHYGSAIRSSTTAHRMQL